jgi:hypothetical protein
MSKQVEHIRTKDGKPFVAGSLPLNEEQFIALKSQGIDLLTEETASFSTFMVTTQPVKRDGFGFRMLLEKPLEFSDGYIIKLWYILPKQWGYVFELFVPDVETAKIVMKYILPVIALNAFDKRVGRKKIKEIVDGLKTQWGVRFLRCIEL